MVTAYKWSLRKGGKKLRCPQCGQKRFVPFVLTADGKTMAGAEFGRCDREQSCGYFRYPDKEARATVEVEPRPELPPALMKLETHLTPVYPMAIFYQAFKWIDEGKSKADFNLCDALIRYKCWLHEDYCIFPQFDGEWMRTAKAIRYGLDGHRLKGEDGECLPVYWLHKSPQYAEYMQSHQLKQCFFGQHLLAQYPQHDVWIVEAEKTAVLMAATDKRKDRIWLACGGSQMLKGAIDLECLSGREVTLVPDDGQYWNWKRIADAHWWKCLEIGEYREQFTLNAGYDIWDIKEMAIKKVRQWK